MTQNKYLVLCKVGVEINESSDGQLCADSVHNLEFVYKKKVWRLYDYFSQDAQKLILAIKSMECNRSRKLCCIIEKNVSNDINELVIGHYYTTNRSSLFEEELAACLLQIIFKDYKHNEFFGVDNGATRNEDELLKAYVTTQLYDALYARHLAETTDIDAIDIHMPDCFQPELRSYQMRTVKWLLKREQKQETAPDYYEKLTALDGETQVLKHKYCLQFVQINNDDIQQMVYLPPGGILADEMGLGKTVELLALVLLNPRKNFSNSHWNEVFEEIQNTIPLKRKCIKNDVLCICPTQKDRNLIECTRCGLKQHKNCVNSYAKHTEPSSDDYICPMCWTELTKTTLYESGTTFIVTPNTIKMQWQAEICKHTNPNLKILLYNGMNSGTWVSPAQLAEFDIVITDYDKLRREIYHTADYKSNRSTRQPPRFMRPTSPLMMVNWWRVCLDEAQMVESNTSKAAELTRMLPACNRWAVTGTPIQRSIDDLVPLLRFIGLEDLYEPKDAWDYIVNEFLLNRNSDSLIILLRHCMWRTCKSKVQNELEIPEQKCVVHRLELSNIERLYYRDEHNNCTNGFYSAVRKHIKENTNSRLAKISPQILKLILQPLLKIRQCCSMPVVQSKSGHLTQKQFMHPKELHEHLKLLNENECKSQLRTWASSYNGIAAIYFLRKDFKNSISHYAKVIDLAKQYTTKNICVDSLLQIHAIYNMLEANLMALPEQILNPAQIEAYQKQLKLLECKYVDSYISLLMNVRTAYEDSCSKYKEILAKNKCDISRFVVSLVTNAERYHEPMLKKIHDECSAQGITRDKLRAATTLNGVLYIIDTWYSNLKKLKQQLFREFNMLKEFSIWASRWQKAETSELPIELCNFVKNVSECHLNEIRVTDRPKRSKEPKKKLCQLCRLRKLINEFECLLFAKELDEETSATEGLENPTFEIVIIKVIFGFLKTKASFIQQQHNIENQLLSLEWLQIICKKQIKYWIEAEYTVKAYDELDMCKMRISVTNNVIEKTNYCVLVYELNDMMTSQKANIQQAQLQFTRLQGRLKYLKHLEDDTSDKPCPVCQTEDDERYVVLECGHFLCSECLDIIKAFNRHERITCPVCRAESIRLYYSLRKTSIGNSCFKSDFQYSSKITAIVNLVLNLRTNDATTKILIFSQWDPILKAISKAFDEVGISNRSQCTPKDIDEFKDPNGNVTCMLMLFSRGSKGLNLIEATHVFLVEPILNPSEELQAIGRVHRFGQKKPTTVHKFIVDDTIEDNILKLITSIDDKQTLSTHWELENLTLDNLKSLFVLKSINDDN